MSSISDMENKLSTVDLQEKQMLSKKLDKAKIKKMPFWKRIQQEGQERELKQTYDTQKWAFERIMKKDNDGRAVSDWFDEFILFWTDFLKGEVPSANVYLKRKTYKFS
jgi:hypothetical protein